MLSYCDKKDMATNIVGLIVGAVGTHSIYNRADIHRQTIRITETIKMLDYSPGITGLCVMNLPIYPQWIDDADKLI